MTLEEIKQGLGTIFGGKEQPAKAINLYNSNYTPEQRQEFLDSGGSISADGIVDASNAYGSDIGFDLDGQSIYGNINQPSGLDIGGLFNKDGMFGSTGPVMQGLGTLESGFKFYDTFFGYGKDYRKAQASLAGKQNMLADQILAENTRKAANDKQFASYFGRA